MDSILKLLHALIECKPQEVVNKYARLVAKELGKEGDLKFLKSIGYVEIEKEKVKKLGE